MPAVWDDIAVDWAGFDLVVLRSTWDYPPRHEEFVAWAASVPRLLNGVRTVAWNTDKHYLRELAAAGVAVVPTTWVKPGEDYRPPAFEHVVKPVVSGGAVDTSRYAAGEDSTPHVRRLLEAGRSAMVQPYLMSVEEQGETALVHLGGVFSHAVRKGAALAHGVTDVHAVELRPVDPTPAQLRLAAAALAVAPEPVLYARVDVVAGDDGSPLLLELELTEPSLFLRTSPGAVERLADAVVAELPPVTGEVRPARR